MQDSIRLFFVLLYLTCKVYSQAFSQIDTIKIVDGSNSIELSKKFILKESVNIYHNGQWVSIDNIDFINGIISLNKDIIDNSDALFIVSYKYINNRIPMTIGPRWKSLQTLNILEDQPKFNNQSTKIRKKEENEIFSSGTFHRKLKISPLGGSDFTGGFQMQLNGQLSNNIYVTGMLSDQNLPIQPEGTTRRLEELDKVLISVKHSNYSVDAGDIILDDNNNVYDSINRKLIGLKNTFNYNNWTGGGVYASSKGNYAFIEIKGRDGDQGPYRINGEDGNRNIIILSGTEKVWIEGEELIRGEKYDYTIDYSLAEIKFTSRNLIHSDTDIFIEYQYTDFQYQKSFTGGSIKKEFDNRSSLSLGIFNESDQFQISDWSDDTYNKFLNSKTGKIREINYTIKDDGDYIQSDSIFIYDPNKDSNDSTRFLITFSFDVNGSYRRKISDKGQIYYEYLEPDDRSSSMELYSPYRNINSPQSTQYGFIKGQYNLGKNIKLLAQLNESGFNQNSINSQNSFKRGASQLFDIKIDSVDFGLVSLSLSISDWNRNNNYKSLKQENNIMSRRFWNLDSISNNNIRETNIKSILSIDNFGDTFYEFGHLNQAQSKRTRFNVNQTLAVKLFRNSYFNYLLVNNLNGRFIRRSSRLQINYKIFSPFIDFLDEKNPDKNKFSNIGGGFKINFNNTSFESGINFREDEKHNLNQSLPILSEDLIGFVNLKSKMSKGWKKDIIYKKRIKKINNNLEDFNYSLSRVFLSYNDSNHPINWEITAKTEESFLDQRSVVYDSIGIGLGQYRYDKIFNTYIPDPNGSYIAYTVTTGDRIQTSVLDTRHKIAFDFNKSSISLPLLLRSNSRIDYRGDSKKIETLFKPDISDLSISKLILDSRIEILFSGNFRLLSWLDIRRRLDGLDPRGNNLNSETNYGLEYNKVLTNYLAIRLKNNFHLKYIESNISSLRNRRLNGWWSEAQYLYKIKDGLDIDISLIYGNDYGEQQENNFNVSAYGIKLDGRYFLNKKGRIQTDFSLINVIEKTNQDYIPPESVNGNPLGIGFRSNTRIQYFINQSISLIFSLNTIDDQRFSNFLTFEGEVRAHF